MREDSIIYLKTAEKRILNSNKKDILLESLFVAVYTLFSVYAVIADKSSLLDDNPEFYKALIEYEPDKSWPYSKDEMILSLSDFHKDIKLEKWNRFVSVHSDVFV